jgi:hypothetical protein
MRRHLFGICVGVIAFTSAVFIYHHSTYNIGRIEACLDLLRGKYIIKSVDGGSFAAEKDKHNAVLKEFDVELIIVEGCDITKELREELGGYDEVSLWAINKRYGRIIWETLSQRLGHPTQEEQLRMNREFAKRCELLK